MDKNSSKLYGQQNITKTNFNQKIRQINQSQTFIANFTTYCFKFEKGRARHKSHLPKTKNNMVGVGEQLPPRLQK